MASKIHNRHDHSYKLLFSHPEMVRDLLTGFVKEAWVEQLDFSTLEKTNSKIFDRKISFPSIPPHRGAGLILPACIASPLRRSSPYGFPFGFRFSGL